MAKEEFEKTEECLGINAFDKPLEASGAEAWAKQVAYLLFMTPGTMPTDPEMPTWIQQFQFSFLDDVRDNVRQLIQSQIKTYFPDMPLEDVTIEKQESSYGPIMLIILQFDTDSNDNIAVVAAEKRDSVINFDIIS